MNVLDRIGSDPMALAHDLAKAIAAERAATVKAALAERAAWARLVRAAIDERDATFADEQCQPGAVEWLTRTRAEYEAALDGLRVLGVDVDRLLEAK